MDDQESVEQEAEGTRTACSGSGRFAGPAGHFAAWREFRYAKRVGRGALDLYQRLVAVRPDLSGRALYAGFVCEWGDVSLSEAEAILWRAEASFASWPAERELIFRDVVQYLAISEYLRRHPKRMGTVTNMSGVIRSAIPGTL